MGKWKPKQTKRLDNKINKRYDKQLDDNLPKFSRNLLRSNDKFITKNIKGKEKFYSNRSKNEFNYDKNKSHWGRGTSKYTTHRRVEKDTGIRVRFPSTNRNFKKMTAAELNKIIKQGVARKKGGNKNALSKGSARGDMVKAMQELNLRKGIKPKKENWNRRYEGGAPENRYH